MAGLLFLILIGVSLVIIFDGIPVIKRKVDEFSEHLTEDEEERIDRIQKEAVKKAEAEYQTEKKKIKTFSVSGIGSKNVQKEETKNKENKSEDVSFADTIKSTFKTSNNEKIILPPLNLLSKDKGKASAGDIKENANIIKNTLASFGISVEIDSVMVGPTVTRYALKPAQGVKLSKIAALHDNLALALAAKSIVIQVPIPGEALVGIEIPNKNTTMVGAGSLFGSKEFINSEFNLPIAIGKNISGDPEIIGLDKAPHMLVAGQTGAGKSVTVHAIINSLLYKHGPDMLKFILIDPKKVEMVFYEGIPHLYTPVIKDAKKAILALRWAVNEMERRYDVLVENGVNNIDSYHKIVEKEKQKKPETEKEQMPYIVIIIDELSDIMMQYPKELEAGIVSIAQKARAVGIHLVLSTQRPSVNVVTGLIKANIPTRVALSVASAIDSKTILDMAGAEKLLGKGDMLYKTGSMAKPVRVQSSFISEDEVKSVVKFIKKAYKSELGDAPLDFSDPNNKKAEEVYGGDENEFKGMDIEGAETQSSGIAFDELESDMDREDLDDLFDDAKAEVIASGKASTSYLQRKFRIGYSRAASLIDQLEEEGVIGPPNGSKPREVLIER
jgi:S-DNA-T family DNA segregation ATPase FtsK/SpoIIIE